MLVKFVYCEFCRNFKSDKECFYCKKYYNYCMIESKHPQIYKNRKVKGSLVPDGPLKKNENNDCPDFSPRLSYKIKKYFKGE
ncbi:MAG: hypothetical protein ACOCRK_01015 [bacterium]